jgi:CHASE2 domain-containing sensor protein
MQLTKLLQHISLNQLRSKIWFRTLTITLLALALSHSILYQITSSPIFAQQKDNDYEMSDFYNQVANNRPVRTFNSEIVILSIDNCSRADIAKLVDIVSYMQPKAIGIDVFFSYHSEEDSVLIAALNQNPNIVLAYDAYQETQTAFAQQLPHAHWGAINLITKRASGTIRQFKPQFNDSTFAFSAQLARIANTSSFHQLIQRGNEFETIHFPSQSFDEVNGQSILHGQINLLDLEELLANKIVLMGDIHNPFDQHKTPINSNMPGIIINAHILSTILSGNYIEHTPLWFNWTIAILTSLLLSFSIVYFQTNNILKSYTTFMIRVFQVAIITLFLYIGCYIFADYHYYCNFAPALFMVGLGVLSVAVEPVVYLLLQGIQTCITYLIKAIKTGTQYLNKAFRAGKRHITHWVTNLKNKRNAKHSKKI